jgi:hypothetical protein
VRLTKKISSIIMYSYNFLMSAYEYFPRFPWWR